MNQDLKLVSLAEIFPMIFAIWVKFSMLGNTTLPDGGFDELVLKAGWLVIIFLLKAGWLVNIFLLCNELMCIKLPLFVSSVTMMAAVNSIYTEIDSVLQIATIHMTDPGGGGCVAVQLLGLGTSPQVLTINLRTVVLVGEAYDRLYETIIVCLGVVL